MMPILYIIQALQTLRFNQNLRNSSSTCGIFATSRLFRSASVHVRVGVRNIKRANYISYACVENPSGMQAWCNTTNNLQQRRFVTLGARLYSQNGLEGFRPTGLNNYSACLAWTVRTPTLAWYRTTPRTLPWAPRRSPHGKCIIVTLLSFEFSHCSFLFVVSLILGFIAYNFPRICTLVLFPGRRLM